MSEAMDRLSAALSGRYEIERQLGEGGMATVYLATDVRHERKVALKVLRPELAATMGPDRFLQEVRVTANLQHPHILPLFDSGEADGFLYYVMPYLEGESLRDRLARESELPVAEAVKILREVVDALAAAHQMGVVHRDIKPDNVMLSGRHAVVTDFGVAKAVSEATGRHQLTTVGVALGTPSYMAPEQAAADENIDHRADIYAVGAMGYELLAGRPPFSGMTPQRVLSAHVTEVPQDVTQHRAAVPPQLGAVIMRCLEKKPADRWQSAEALLQQLEIFATPTTGITPTQSVPTGAAPAVTTGTPLWMKVAAPVALVAILLAVWLGGREPVAVGVTASDGSAVADSGFVVVPFVNETGVDSLDTFGSVLSNYVTGQIDRNRLSWVVPSTTVRDLAAGRPNDAGAVDYYARESGARFVVTGSYFTQGSSLVVQGEVTDGPTSELVASVGPIEGTMDDFMAPVRAAAEQILITAGRILDPLGTPPSVGSAPPSYAAYRDYAEGNDLWIAGERERALELFYRALEQDSTYVEARLMASTTEWNLGDIAKADSVNRITAHYRSEMGPWDAAQFDWLQGFFDGDREAIYRAGRRIAELDPVNRGGGPVCRGARMAFRLREALPACEAVYEASVVAGSGVLGFFGADHLVALHGLGEHEEELWRAREARQNNPDGQLVFIYEARALAALARTDELRALLDEALTYGADWSVGIVLLIAGLELRAHGIADLGEELLAESLEWHRDQGDRDSGTVWSLFATGDYEGTRTLAEELIAEGSSSTTVLGLLGSAAAAMGDRDAALDVAGRLMEREAEPYVFGGPAAWRARIIAQLGDQDDAVRALQEAYEAGATYGTWLHADPQFDGMAGHPGFERFRAPKE